MGALRIDFVFGDAAQREQRRNQQQHRDDKHRARRKEITACAHRRGSKPIANRGKAGIAAEPFADGGMADETEADRGDRGSEHAACRRVQDRRAKHRREDRQRRISERADADRHHREAGKKAL